MSIKNSLSLTLSVADHLQAIPSSEWDRLAGLSKYSPFLEHAFLSTLEESGCAAPENGWYPRHVILKNGEHLVGAAPMYGKTHSMGEFIFDQGFAQVSESLDMPYYPKLVATLPFTPSPGYRFLVDPDYDTALVESVLLQGMRQLRDMGAFSSLGILFVDPDWEENLHRADESDPTPSVSENLGLQRWTHQYFLWENRGYCDFDNYLSRFRKNQRRNIQRERRSVRDAGVNIDVISGTDISDTLMEQMYAFYESTNENYGPWAAFFLNKEWFRLIGRRWRHRLLLFVARLPGDSKPVAMSLLVKKGKHLTGRYWGARQFVRNLHFELCYYAPIEYAIQENIQVFDPGMGSPHKARRGFGSVEFGSFHDFSHPQMAMLFQSVIAEANRAETEMIEELDHRVPWKNP